MTEVFLHGFVEVPNATKQKTPIKKSTSNVTNGGDKISKWKKSGFAPLESKNQYICRLCRKFMLQSIVQSTLSGSLACEDCYREGLK